MNKKTIVFVNQSSGYLMIDIIHAVGKHYSKSVLIAGAINPETMMFTQMYRSVQLIIFDDY